MKKINSILCILLLLIVAYINPIYAKTIEKATPKVTNIKIMSPDTGIYKAGKKIIIRVYFSEAIEVGTAPKLKLKIGEKSVNTTLKSINTKSIDYTYTTKNTDNGTVSIGSYSGGKITDKLGNIVKVQTKQNTGNSIKIDTIIPKITSIKIMSPQNGTYKAGRKIIIRVNFNEVIKVATAPKLKLKIGEKSVDTILKSINSKCIDYTYTSKNTDNGIVSIGGYSGGKVTDKAGNIAKVQTKSNTGNTIKINNEVGVEIKGVKVTESVHANDWKQKGLLVSPFTQNHDGIDIDGVAISPLVALKTGKVTKVIDKNVKKGDGTVRVINITVQHQDGTIQQYLHLKEKNFAVGDTIKEGQQISSRGYIPESITACAKGTVTYADEENGRVWVDLGNGLIIRYLHMSSISVKKGDKIAQGDEIGKMGDIMTKYDPPCSHVHLHISFVLNGRFINPRQYIYNK